LSPLDLPDGERSLADARAQAKQVNTTDLELVKTDLPDPVNADAPLVYTLSIIDHDPQPADVLPFQDVAGWRSRAPDLMLTRQGPSRGSN
jgi:hypothetical protein